MGAETERDFKRIRRVVQMDARQFDVRRLVGLRQAVIKQRRGSVAVGVNHLQGRFPNIAIARLRIKFIVARKFCTGIVRADGPLIKAAIVTHLKIHRKTFGSSD